MKDMTVMSLKIEKSLKEAAQKTAAEFGLPLGTMINAMLKEIVRNKTFAVSIAERPSARLIQSMKDSAEDYKNGDFVTATTAEELDAILTGFAKV